MMKLKKFLHKLSKYTVKNRNTDIISIGTNHDSDGGYSLHVQLESGKKETIRISEKTEKPDTKEINLKIIFRWDESYDTHDFMIMIPSGIDKTHVMKELRECHDFLCFDDADDIYGTEGRCPETLVHYMCKKNKWLYQDMEFDIKMEFD